MDVFLYSVLGTVILLVAWVLPGRFIKPLPPRLLCQFLAVVVAAFFLPAPSDPGAAFLAGQYAFAGALLIAIIGYAIANARA